MSSVQDTFIHWPLQPPCGQPEAAAAVVPVPASTSASAPAPAPVLMPTPAPTPARSRAIWSVEDDEILIDMLLEAQARGVRLASEQDAIWEEAAARVNAGSSRRLGAKKTAKKCHVRLVHLKLTLSDVEYLRDKLGVGWDNDKKMLVATPERWDELVERNQRFKKFRDNPLPLYEKITLLLSKSRVKPEPATNTQLPIAKIETKVDPPIFGPSPQLPTHATWQCDTLQYPITPLPPNSDACPPLTQLAEPSVSSTTRPLDSVAGHTPQEHMTSRPEGSTSVIPDGTLLPVPSTTAKNISPMSHSAATALSRGDGDSSCEGTRSAQRRTEAIRLMEADEAYSIDEQVSIVELFEQRPAAVHSFLAITNKHVRTLYARRALAQHNRGSSRGAGSCIIA